MPGMFIMPGMSRSEYYNITSLTIGAAPFTGIKMVAVTQRGKRITDASDNDTNKSFQAVTDQDTTLEIDCVDPAQSVAIKASVGATVFAGSPANGNNNSSGAVTVTVAGCLFNSLSVGAKYGDMWSQRIGGGAVNGGANPLTVVQT